MYNVSFTSLDMYSCTPKCFPIKTQENRRFFKCVKLLEQIRHISFKIIYTCMSGPGTTGTCASPEIFLSFLKQSLE